MYNIFGQADAIYILTYEECKHAWDHPTVVRLWTAVRVNGKRRATWLDQVVAESTQPDGRGAEEQKRSP